jgi:dienelactone hydrolase
MKTRLIMALIAVAGVASAGLVEREVEYTDGATTMRGFLVYDDQKEGLRPGVLVVHEWWGHNEYARRRARELAEQGYIALAVDMYGEGRTAAHPADAGRFAAEVMRNRAVGVARFRAARAFLEQQPQTDPARLAAIGHCFGGAVVLHMARIGEDLKLVASFHGSLGTDTPARPREVRARVLVYHGGADALVPEADVVGFEKEMRRAEAEYRLVVYPDAPHSFTVPEADAKAAEFGLPIGYNAEADRASWSDLLENLREVFEAP